MPRERPKIGVQIAGTRFLRFVIANDQQQVWTGLEWSDRRGDALLYAHVEVVRQDVKILKRRLREAGDK
jgi:Ethanolamine utilization protein EutJ (predicted chaperonin)